MWDTCVFAVWYLVIVICGGSALGPQKLLNIKLSNGSDSTEIVERWGCGCECECET